MNNISKLFCDKGTPLSLVMEIINRASVYDLPAGIALVINKQEKLVGTITDGDIRRSLLRGFNPDLTAGDVMNSDPIYFNSSITRSDILTLIPKRLSEKGRKANRFLSKVVLVDDQNRPTRILEYHELWEQKVANHRHIVVVGLGYVGLTMALVMADAGFLVTGVELDEHKRLLLSRGDSYIHELGLEELLRREINNNFSVSEELPEEGDVYIISVGTPVDSEEEGIKRPDLRFLEDAASKIGRKLQRGNLVVLRSTVPIGISREVVKPILEDQSGLKCGLDFHLSFAPERTAEGKALQELRSLPQIIGGYNKESVEATAAIFRDLTPMIVRVNSLEEAEMAKLINNSFRDYIFAFSNHMAKIASKFNIDVVDVINAANEGYARDPVPLPSPGVGGPCLTKDPHIFASVAEKQNFEPTLFINGRSINESMHDHVVAQIKGAVTDVGKDMTSVKIYVLGLAFKGHPETGDIRNSSGVEIAQQLQQLGAEIIAFDPAANKREIEALGFKVDYPPAAFNGKDVVIFLNNHRSFQKIDVFNMVRALNPDPVIYDGWRIFRPLDIVNTRPCIYMNLSLKKSSII